MDKTILLILCLVVSMVTAGTDTRPMEAMKVLEFAKYAAQHIDSSYEKLPEYQLRLRLRLIHLIKWDKLKSHIPGVDTRQYTIRFRRPRTMMGFMRVVCRAEVRKDDSDQYELISGRCCFENTECAIALKRR